MLRLSQSNRSILPPDLSIWRRGHLRLDSLEEQLCYFWTKRDELITRENFRTAGPKLLVAHPSDHILEGDRFDVSVVRGHHLYRISPQYGCVERPSEPTDFFKTYTGQDYLTFDAVYFTPPAGTIPVEVTYLGTVPHED